ncbi:MAG: exonuclease domain-containing protein [Planctomycetota bacterium]|nr:exonuclease domain-containing protein [Planctomycetota bacterium]
MGIGREFVVFDTETTGMPPSGRLVEIGALKVRGGAIVDRFDRLVFPEAPIPQAVIAIHGITDAMVADAEDARAVVSEFLAWIGSAPLLGHNVSFDATVLAAECRRFNLNLPDNPTWCTLRASRGLLKRRSHSLQSLVAELGLPPAQHHRALADAQHTLNLWWRLCEVGGSEGRGSDAARGKNLSHYSPEDPRLEERDEMLREASLTGEAVDLAYRLASGRLSALRVSPRLFYRSGGHLWMEALCHEACFYKTYRLDRITGARPCPDAAPVAPRRFPTRRTGAAADGLADAEWLP